MTDESDFEKIFGNGVPLQPPYDALRELTVEMAMLKAYLREKLGGVVVADRWTQQIEIISRAYEKVTEMLATGLTTMARKAHDQALLSAEPYVKETIPPNIEKMTIEGYGWGDDPEVFGPIECPIRRGSCGGYTLDLPQMTSKGLRQLRDWLRWWTGDD